MTGNSDGIAESLERIQQAGSVARAALLKELDRLNDRVKKSISPVFPSDVDFYALSRHLLYAAMSITDDHRIGVKKQRRATRRSRSEDTDQPAKNGEPIESRDQAFDGSTLPDPESLAWKPLLTTYAALYEKAPDLLASIDTDDAMLKFARLESRTNGVGLPRYYASIAILLVHLSDLKLLASDRFRHICPDSELDLAGGIRVIVEAMIARIENRPLTIDTTPSDVTPSRPPWTELIAPAVWIRFPYSHERLGQLTELQSRFAFSEDECAHFVVYRPSRSDPCKLIKSFFVLEGPEVDHDFPDAEDELAEEQPKVLDGRIADIIEFRHYYQNPSDELAPVRVSAGRAIPLEHGLYLVGGQRMGNNRELPFSALKMLALPWTSIRNHQQLIGGLAISTNLHGLQIASRVAIRATPTDHSDKILLGELSIDKLVGDLTADAAVEHALMVEALGAEASLESMPYAAKLSGGKLEKQLRKQRDQILKMCNNVRVDGWNVLPGFENDDHSLDKGRITTEIRHLFDAQNYTRSIDDREEPFSIEAIRGATLMHD